MENIGDGVVWAAGRRESFVDAISRRQQTVKFSLYISVPEAVKAACKSNS